MVTTASHAVHVLMSVRQAQFQKVISTQSTLKLAQNVAHVLMFALMRQSVFPNKEREIKHKETAYCNLAACRFFSCFLSEENSTSLQANNMLILFKDVYNCFRRASVFEIKRNLVPNTRVLRAFNNLLIIKQLYDLMLFKSFIDIKNVRDLRQITLQSASSYGVI